MYTSTCNTIICTQVYKFLHEDKCRNHRYGIYHMYLSVEALLGVSTKQIQRNDHDISSLQEQYHAVFNTL